MTSLYTQVKAGADGAMHDEVVLNKGRTRDRRERMFEALQQGLSENV